MDKEPNSVCLRCHQKCPIHVEVEDGEITGVSGQSCVKGATIPDVMYHPDRLKFPLRRAGERGEGEWERISWEEATDTIAEKFNEISEEYGSDKIVFSSGSYQKHVGSQAVEMARVLIPTPNIHHGTGRCIIPETMGDVATVGEQLTYEFNPDYENSKCMVFWGSNPIVTTPYQWKDILEAKKNGAKIIVIDPRYSETAEYSDLWLKIRPGTDGALALAWLNIIINEGLYDSDFVDKYTVGFDELKERVQEYPPSEVAEITGLDEEEIIESAKMYVENKPASIYTRCGSCSQKVNAGHTARAIACLVAICGNIDVPGGNALYHRNFIDAGFHHQYSLQLELRPPREVQEKRIGKDVAPFTSFTWPMFHWPTMLDKMHEGVIKAYWPIANNPIVANENNRSLWDALKNKIDFFVVSEYFMTPTAEIADIVLPAAFYQEIDNLVESFVLPPYLFASKRAVEPIGECRDDRDVLIEVAKKMGRPVRWEDSMEFNNWRLEDLDVTFDEIWEMPGHKLELPLKFRKYEKADTPFYLCPSGKVELYSKTLEFHGIDPLPHYDEPVQSPESTPELFEDYPLIYTHRRLMGYEHSEGRQIERQRKMHQDPRLEINSETAKEHGIEDGDWVWLETPGFDHRIRFKAKLDPKCHPDTVIGDHAWWFPEKPGPEHGAFESNINAILSHEGPFEPLMGTPECRALLCKIGKEGE